MDYSVEYMTESGKHTFRFLMRKEGDRWQTNVMNGPSFPGAVLRHDEVPPGCDRIAGAYRIRWFGMACITSREQAQALAALWAEDIERFLVTGKWRTKYQTNDGRDNFTFSIERDRRSFRIYIDKHPSYRNRATDAHSTHRYSDGDRHYICWDGKLNNWAEAEDIATAWAERTQGYIRTGRFQNTGS
ncbi:MAG: hypothetical protein PF904_04710 [Kiritimatiellae bacterium]|jgi:hypothetical protein|nr:hypothetical protein [Kiritimatiellia bacterium]